MEKLTCLITGKTDNLRMHALRNSENAIIGWAFVHEDVVIKDMDVTVEWRYKAVLATGEATKLNN